MPRHPGVLSAAGLLAAPVEHEISTALPRVVDELDLVEVRTTLERLDARCRALMAQENVSAGDIAQRYFADVCYAGQGYHLEVPFEPDAADPLAGLTAAFFAAHDRTYGFAPKASIRLVNLRAVHSVAAAEYVPDDWTPAGGSPLTRRTRILLPERQASVDAAVYDRAALKAGDAFDGPAIIEQDDTTTLLMPGWRAHVDDLGNLVLERKTN